MSRCYDRYFHISSLKRIGPFSDKRKLWRWDLIWLFCLLMVACPLDDCDSAAGPSPTPEPTTTTTVPAKPPRIDQPFAWEGASGFSLFAGLRLEDSEIEGAFLQARNAQRDIARVCAETEFWPGTEDYPRIPRDLERLDGFLDTVARIPGAQVLLMSNCTLKHGGLGWEPQREWNRKVAQVASEYANVAIEVVNEPYHYGHFFHGKENLVRQLIREARSASGGLLIGADDSFCTKRENLRHYLYSSVDFASFHPCRNTGNKPWDPPKSHLRELVDENGGLAVLSETVAWDDNGDECDHFLRTCDKERIRIYERRCEATHGCIYFFHSENGLAARVPFSWMGR